MTPAFKSSMCEVFDRPGRGDVTLVTFGNAASLADGRSFWGDSLADALDLDCVGIMPRHAHWYPLSDMLGAARIMAPRLAGRRVVLYGDGMGGYAAIRHAALFSPAAVIAVSPQYSINPADLPGDQRFHQHFRPALHMDMTIAAAHRTTAVPFLVHDPREPMDRLNAERIRAALPVHAVPVTYAGPQAVHVMSSSTVFAQVLQAALAGNPRGMAGVLRRHKKQNRAYLGEIGAACLTAGHRRWSAEALRRAQAAGTPLADILWLRARAHRRADRWAAMEADARASLALPDPGPARRADLYEALFVHLRPRSDAAAAIAARARAEFPPDSQERTRLESVFGSP